MSDGGAVEILTIGDELLLGATIDGNAAWIGQRLAAAGIRIARRATVGDDASAIRTAVAEALDRTGIVVCTGGLGPTRDDLTRPIVAELFGAPLHTDKVTLERIRDRMRSLGHEMSETNRVQAEVPEGAVVFPNSCGTAPGLALEDTRGRVAILLPGVPSEMRALMDEHVVAFLTARLGAGGRPIVSRTVRTTGIPESTLAERIDAVVDELAPLRIAFLPDAGGVDLRLTSWGELTADEADRQLGAAVSRLSDLLGDDVYGFDDEDLVTAVARLLKQRQLKLALAESCTGGLIAKRLTDPAGASNYLTAGIVSYANEAKESILGVSPETLRAHGAVSEATAMEMVGGATRVGGAECGIAVTGVAGPGGGSEEKPVGTVWIAVQVEERVEARLHRFSGDRDHIRERSAQAALAMLRRMLLPEPA